MFAWDVSRRRSFCVLFVCARVNVCVNVNKCVGAHVHVCVYLCVGAHAVCPFSRVCACVDVACSSAPTSVQAEVWSCLHSGKLCRGKHASQSHTAHPSQSRLRRQTTLAWLSCMKPLAEGCAHRAPSPLPCAPSCMCRPKRGAGAEVWRAPGHQ